MLFLFAPPPVPSPITESCLKKLPNFFKMAYLITPSRLIILAELSFFYNSIVLTEFPAERGINAPLSVGTGPLRAAV